MPVNTREPPLAGEIQRRDLAHRSRKQPCMRHARAGPGRRLIVQFRVLREGRFGLAIGDDRFGFVALVHLDAVRVELVDLVGDRLADLPARCSSAAGVSRRAHPCSLHHHRIDGVEQAERLEDRTELRDRLVGAVDDLLGDWRAFGA